MCSRYTITSRPDVVRAHFDYLNDEDFPERAAIAPTDPVLIVREIAANRRTASLVRWGLIPHWVKDPDDFPLLINARAETLNKKPSFRSSLAHKRCIFPADGFYEWSGEKGRRQAHFLKPTANTPIAFAGLWDHWQGADGTEFESAAIITIESNKSVGKIHNRMPAILESANFDDWLNVRDVTAKEAALMLRPAPEGTFNIIDIESAPKPVRREKSNNEPKSKRTSSQGELF